MARTRKGQPATKRNGGDLGFEAKLWAAADALRKNMDAAEYTHVVLGLIFLKYISDAFEARHAEFEAHAGRLGDLPAPRTWRGDRGAGEYAYVGDFCAFATLDDICEHGHALTPGRYVGAEAEAGDREPFEEKMWWLVAQLGEQPTETAKLDAAITANLKELGGWESKA